MTSNNGKRHGVTKTTTAAAAEMCPVRGVAKQSRVFMLRETKVHLHVLRSKLSVANVLHCIFRFFIRWNKN